MGANAAVTAFILPRNSCWSRSSVVPVESLASMACRHEDRIPSASVAVDLLQERHCFLRIRKQTPKQWFSMVQYGSACFTSVYYCQFYLSITYQESTHLCRSQLSRFLVGVHPCQCQECKVKAASPSVWKLSCYIQKFTRQSSINRNCL